MSTLVDPFGRQISYLRLAVTDRCNLRCQYCMPAEGIDIVPRQELLTFKEMYRITRVLSELGVNKIRLTGGEPFVRKDFINLVKSLSHNERLDQINITTNGALVKDHIASLTKLRRVIYANHIHYSYTGTTGTPITIRDLQRYLSLCA